jgi:hypothetical protein
MVEKWPKGLLRETLLGVPFWEKNPKNFFKFLASQK